jgi:hypothetical protein
MHEPLRKRKTQNQKEGRGRKDPMLQNFIKYHKSLRDQFEHMKHKKLKATGRKEGLAVPLIIGFPITTEIKSKPIKIKRAKSPPTTIHHTSQNYVHEQKKKKKLNPGDPFPAKLSIKKFLI